MIRHRTKFVCLVTITTFLVQISGASLAAMSIDFGSQYIKMALVKPGVPMEIVLNEESGRKLPNIIMIRDKQRSVGEAALRDSIKYSRNSFTYLVDLLGKKFDSPIVSLHRQRFPHLEMMLDDARGTVQFGADGETYNVETLIAMILRRCRDLVEKFAKQSVESVVITVPAFFNQAERHAMVTAADIAGLNLLQLLNDHSAAALSYGAFRRNEITDKPQTLLIYDVGASKVTASILQYALLAEEKGNEKSPVITTLGIGYDRTVGGFEITHRFRDIFVEEFRKTKKTKVDVLKNPRAMAKFLLEAERVKIILSANFNFTAQIENVHEEQDFSMPVSRALLEAAVSDLEAKFVQPIVDALKMAGLTAEEIDHVVLMGGGSRVPVIQKFVQDYLKRQELGKFLNTDEAVAMGAVYQAAYLSKGFKVKKLHLRDLQIFPVQVDFMSTSNKEETSVGHLNHRPLYIFKSSIPAPRKVLSFSSFTSDFSFNINYGEMNHLTADQLREFGSLNISEVKLEGVTDAYSTEATKEGTIFKGIKTHFNLDGSGILHVDGAEMLMERTSRNSESTFASLAGKITGLFSSNNKRMEEKEESSKIEINNPNQDKVSNITKNGNKIVKPSEDNVANKTDTAAETIRMAANLTDIKKEEKPRQIKIPLKLKETRLDVGTLSGSEVVSARKRIAEFERREREAAIREEAHHNLESLTVDLTDKLTQEEFRNFLTADEQASLEKEVLRVKMWLEDVGVETPTEDFNKNKKGIDELLEPINVRIVEDRERPLIVEQLISMLNRTEIFLLVSKNLTEAGVFTEVEINVLSKLLNETKSWLTEKSEQQSELKPTDPPAFTVSEGKEKLVLLDREVKYLLNKMKFGKPKTRREGKVNGTVAENNDTVSKATTESNTASTDTYYPPPIDGFVGEKVEVKEGEVEEEDDDKKNGRIHDASEL